MTATGITLSGSSAGNYQLSSTTATTTANITPATPTLTWTNPAAITYGTALSSTQLNATASVQGSFAYNPVSATVLGAGIQTLFTTFTPSDTTDYYTASASVTISVATAGSSVALVSNNNPSTYNAPVTFTATVTGNPAGPATPSGTVSFYNGPTLIGSNIALSAGVATNPPIATLPGGTDSITASYSGDANYAPSTSPVLVQSVSPVITGLSLPQGPPQMGFVITGQGFGSGGTVWIQFTDGLYDNLPLVPGTAWSSTSLSVQIPPGATQASGNIVVTAGGNANGAGGVNSVTNNPAFTITAGFGCSAQ
ncbi:MAG TPA: Ig-like domain-containing protein [Terriglobia bacterium]|nr:Ig-like domain-containing protein [Terriglobia bacterium]